MAMRVIAIGLAAMLAALAACSSDDGEGALAPSEACQRAVEAGCRRAYECLTPAQIEQVGLPPTEAGCVDEKSAAGDCAHQTEATTCAAGGEYDRAAAGACVDQILAASCAALLDLDSAAPSCSMLCAGA